MTTEKIADFTLPTNGGGTFTLSAQLGKTVVLYFYPKDNTPGCTTEGQDFAALHADFEKANAIVVGVSRDSVKSHDNFCAKFGFPFALISDADEALCTQFEVIKMKNMYGRQVRGIERSTFIIDATGKLAQAWRGVKVAGHAAAVLNAVREINAR
ncbi:MAG: peroxiredoxin [Casimicrobium sp.]